MVTLTWETAAEWDAAQSENGVHHEQPSGTDFAAADIVEKGYATDLSNLQHYMPLQEDSGDANDIVGGGTGTLIGSPTQGAAGILDNSCYDLSTTTDDHVEFGSEGRYANITVCAWVTYGSPPDFSAVVANESGSDDGFRLYHTGTAGEMRFLVNLSGTTTLTATGGDISDGNWHFVVGRYDGSTCELLIDGSSVATDSSSSGDIVYDTGTDLHIGRRASATNNWDGKVNHVLIFNTSISNSLHTELWDAVNGTSSLTSAAKTS